MSAEAPATVPAHPSWRSRAALYWRAQFVVLGALILGGVVLRVIYPGITVFVYDQAKACALTQDIAEGHFHAAGLRNSSGQRNLPGLGYVLAPAWLVSREPIGLLIYSQAINVLAVGAAAWLLYHWFGSIAAWWGTAFLATAPWAIQYTRWIWAQDLLFPVAVVVYFGLWRWLRDRRPWAFAVLALALLLLIQIHFAGLALAIAIALVWLWRPQRLPIAVLIVTGFLTLLSVLPYVLFTDLGPPQHGRFGVRHAWRVIPAALHNLTGLHWWLEFKAGYPDLARYLGPRRWVYEAAMVVPVMVFLWAFLAAVRALRSSGGWQRGAAWTPLSFVVSLLITIPVGFVLLLVRTSPTYLPLLYPLPFALMGWLVARQLEPHRVPGARAIGLSAALLLVMAVQLCFFADQLRYQKLRGGVPNGLLDQALGPLQADLAAQTEGVSAAEVWAVYAGSNDAMPSAIAYLLRGQSWKPAPGGRVVVYVDTWQKAPSRVDWLEADESPPADAWLVFPWRGPHFYAGEVARGPLPGTARDGR